MKHTLLIALLGATVTLATPSLSFADNGYKFHSGVDHKHGKKHAHREHRQKRNNGQKFVPKPPKPHRIVKKIHRDIHNKHRHNKGQRHHNKNHYVKKHHNKHNYRRNEPSFSISWNVGNSTIAYGNDNYAYGHDKHRYNKHRHHQQGLKRIYKRLHNQANRIHNGIDSGQLVRREVKKLRREQRHIKSTLAHYRSDGRLNRYERSKMNQLLDVASNNIHRKKNNRLTRYNKRHRSYNYNYAQF